VPANDTPTASYTLVHLGLRYALDVGPAGAVLFARVQNLGDRLAYNASSLQTIRGLAPLPGRAFSAGLRMAF
jgi:iron complex outermembrane receptor protein